jgi:hypothetical protein
MNEGLVIVHETMLPVKARGETFTSGDATFDR